MSISVPFTLDRTYGCWIYAGRLTATGRGPYREVWERYYDHKVPPGLHLNHECRRRACVNPRHLMAMTQHDNMTRIAPRNRVPSHCPEGHQLLAENTMRTPEGGVVCRLCVNASIADANQG